MILDWIGDRQLTNYMSHSLSSSLSVPEAPTSIPTNSSSPTAPTVYLDGNSLTPELLYDIGSNFRKIGLTQASIQTVSEGRKIIDRVIAENTTVYGVNTGFGLFSKVRINPDQLKDLQINLIRSHSAGIGPYLSLQRTRMLLALRINVLAKGHSGITLGTLSILIHALNENCISCVPINGTVGASGDLAQLAHLALCLLGEGEMWHHVHDTHTAIQMPEFIPMQASKVLKLHNIKPLDLAPKEGLALINGTQFITSLVVKH